MDVAALSLNIDSSSVVRAANDLDRFNASAAKAGVGTGSYSGSIAKLITATESIDRKLSSIVGSLERIARANRAAAAANDNTSVSAAKLATAMAAADAHVVAYTAHLAGLAAVQQNANAHVLSYQNHLSTMAKRQADANAHVLAYRRHLETLTPVLNNNAAANFNASNAAAQFQDVIVTASMGMSPWLIALQQGTQLGAVMQTGVRSLGTAFLQIINPMSLLAIAITAGIALLIQWGMEAFNASDKTEKLSKAIKETQITTYAFSDAQSALGGVIDLTTGKIKTQSEALRGLARAQLEMIRFTALRDKAEAEGTIAKERGRNRVSTQMGGGSMTAGTIALTGRDLGPSQSQSLLDQFTSGKLTSTQAIDRMEKLRDAGRLTYEQFIKLTGAVASFGVAGENLKVYEQARKALNGDQGALSPFLTPDKARKGPKSDAEKLVDIFTSANADIAAEKARALASAAGVTAVEAAKLEKQTSLLNTIQQRGIPITDSIRQKVAGLADEYARMKVNADVSEVLASSTDEMQRQLAAAEDQGKLVGLYGDALARATREMEAQQRLRDALPRGEIVVSPNLTGEVSDKLEDNARRQRLADIDKASRDAAYAIDLEAKSYGLTGAALIAYNFAMDQKLQYQRSSTQLTAEEIAKIDEVAAAYGRQAYALNQMRELENVKIRGLDSLNNGIVDVITGVDSLGNAFKRVADQIITDLLRIAVQRSIIEPIANSLFPAGGSTGNLFSGIGKALGFANGGAFGTPTRFANGGAFTNSVVTSPTLFRFANGAALGEMGESGPEAVMPLSRGPDGVLGVRARGGGGASMGDITINNEYKIDGGFTPDSAVAMIRQGGDETFDRVRRELLSMVQGLDADGSLI